jgi:hypothetical protein
MKSGCVIAACWVLVLVLMSMLMILAALLSRLDFFFSTWPFQALPLSAFSAAEQQFGHRSPWSST